ncbi:SGNH/GDSL hydrolase family protein [Candidatus Woesearchaeota archaeon]|nr:SGNH/GDSL hydrolase family protein [Candidatus Woesearchaeota archaeon]
MKIKELFKNLALLLITIIIFMILFEIALRFFYPQNLSRTQLDKHLLFSNRADLDNVHYNRWNEFNQYISTNSRGLRDYEYSYEKINNSFRILMLGDSFVEGVEVAAENTTSKLLEKQLNQLENGIHYDVINFGVGGYGTSQELAYLERDGIKYSPDVVVLHIFPKNDLLDNIQKDVYLPFNYSTNYPTVSNTLINKEIQFTLFQRFWAFAIAHTHTANLIGIALLSNQNIAAILHRVDMLKTHQFNATNVSYTRDIYLNDPPQQIIDVFGKTKIYLDRMNELAKQYNFTFIIVVIPAKEQVDIDAYKQFIEKEELNESAVAMLAPNYVLQQYAQQNEVIVIDPITLFREKNKQQKLYFVIDGHYKEQGHALLADVLYERLINNEIITK